ncbi:MAG: triose-phosphate isomerase [Candidatus Omnitrophica bacterium]|nr:triose-phosphate isomerase [Candidatus Omnitrophota bacterium]
MYRALSSFMCFIFIFNTILPPQIARAQSTSDLLLPAPGVMVTTSPGFTPTLIKGITIHPENPLQFDFIVDTGDARVQGEELKAEASRLIKYFLASLTVPEKDMWVNLSPYEKNRIIPEGFGATEMGRDLLGQDYILKQLASSLTYPENELGKKFWAKVRAQVQAKYGTTNIPMNTFNKVWIMPDKAVVYEHKGSAFVVESHLKVMLEEDYLALQKNTPAGPASGRNQNAGASQVVREIILPVLEKEVNEGKNFANLRQIYHSMILAVWYKKNLRESLLGQVYVDRNKVKGVDVQGKTTKQEIYEQYLKALKKGAYNYIKEDTDPATQQIIPRKYFSGGAVGLNSAILVEKTDFATLTPQQRGQLPSGATFRVGVIAAELGSKTLSTPTRQIEDALTLTKKPIDKAMVVGEKVGIIAQRITTVRGAQTGEVYIDDAIEEGANGVLAGHSEARKNFRDDIEDAIINSQIRAAHARDLKHIILAVGETGAEKKDGKTEEILKRQVQLGLKDLTAQQIENTVIAYEPRWAISGDGFLRKATEQDAQAGAKFIRQVVAEMTNEQVARKVVIQYGGSVDKSNAKLYLSQPDVDGLLVGGKSTSVAEFQPIIEAAIEVGPKEGRIPYIGANWKTYEVKDDYGQFISMLKNLDLIKVRVGFAPSHAKITKLAQAFSESIMTLGRNDLEKIVRPIVGQSPSIQNIFINYEANGILTIDAVVTPQIAFNGVIIGDTNIRYAKRGLETIGAAVLKKLPRYKAEITEEKLIGRSPVLRLKFVPTVEPDAAMVAGDPTKITISQVIKTSGKGSTEVVNMKKYEGPVGSGKIINPRSMKLIADLMAKYGQTYKDLMRKRSERLAKMQRGEVIPGGKGDVEMDQVIPDAYGGQATVREILEGKWKVDEVPEALKRAGAILTGPWSPKMGISALSGRVITKDDRRLYDEVLTGLQNELPANLVSAIEKVNLKKPDGQLLTQDEKIAYVKATLAKVQSDLTSKEKVVPVRVFADLQDAKIVHGDGSFEGPQTISDIVNGRQVPVVRERDGKVYEVPPKSQWPVITIRIDDMDVSDHHISYNGEAVPDIMTSLVFVIETIYNALKNNPNQEFSLVIPKMESPEEHAFVTKMIIDMQKDLGIEKNISTIFMNETNESALKLELMLWVARHHVKITNVGRWDKGAADMRAFWFWLKKVYGDLGKVSMFSTLMDSYVRDNLVIAKKRGALGEGGMVTLMPSEGNAYPEDDKMAIQTIVVDKLYEWLLGYNYGWVASPSYLPLVQVLFQQPRAFEAVLDDLDYETAKKRLLEFPDVPLTESGLYADVYEDITYLFGYRNTGAAVAIDSLTNHTRSMSDGATEKKVNYHLWMLKNAGAKLTGTETVVTEQLLDQMIDKVLADKGERYRQFVPQSELDIAKILAKALIQSKHLVLWEKELMNSVIDDRDPQSVQRKVDVWLTKYNAEQDKIFASALPYNSGWQTSSKSRGVVQGLDDYAMTASTLDHPTLHERARWHASERKRMWEKEGVFRDYVNTPMQVAAITAPIENSLDVTRYAGRKYRNDQNRNFRNGVTTGTFGVTNQVEMEALARTGKIMNAEITDQHLTEILGLHEKRSEIAALRADLRNNGYLNEKNEATDKFIKLDPKDMKLNGTYSATIPEVYLGVRQVIWNRVKSIYQGGWAEIMKYFGASDQAKAPTTYLSQQPAEMSTLLIMHARHQETAIAAMGLTEEQEKLYRASPKYIDFYIPILMDIDHAHGQPQQIVHANLTVGRDGLLVAAVHLEDQMLKKCGHMPRKSLVTMEDWINAITAVRQKLDALGLYDVSIVPRTDAEDAHVITGDKDGRDQEFLLGLTNFVNNIENLRKTREEALTEVRKKTEDLVKKSKLNADQLESHIDQFMKMYDNMVSFMIDTNGNLRKYADVINSGYEKGLDGNQLEALDELWKKLSGRIRLDKLVEQTITSQIAAGKTVKMNVSQWREFLQTIPRESGTDYLGIVKKQAEELGIVIHTLDEWTAFQKRAPQVFQDGNIHLMWDHTATKIHEERVDFFMIESGLPMAIARNLHSLRNGDNPWMEQKKANNFETMIWAMALDQGVVDLLIKMNYWELLEEYGAKFKQEKGEQIIQILRKYLIQRRLTPENAFLNTRDGLITLGVSSETAVHLINSVSRPKANNTSPSFRWAFAEMGISTKKLQSIIDDILKFLPSFKYVATKAQDFEKIWEDTHTSLGLKAEPILDVKRKMTDSERKNFLTVQGRDSQKQFATYFGEVKNHVLSQLFLRGIDGEEAEAEVQKVLLEIFKGGYLTDEMYVVSKLQELGYLIGNAFTENSQTFAGVVYDAFVETTGKGRGGIFKAFGGASDTQNLDVKTLRRQQKRHDIEEKSKIAQAKSARTNTTSELGELIIEFHEQLVTARSHVTRLVNRRDSLGPNKDSLEEIISDLEDARAERDAISPLVAQTIDKIMPLAGAEQVVITLENVSLDNTQNRFSHFPSIYNEPEQGVKRDLYVLRAALRSVDLEKRRVEGSSELEELNKKEKRIVELIEQGNRLIGEDKAQLATPNSIKAPEKTPLGGINLDPALLDLQIKRDGNGIPLPLSQQPIGDMKIDGFLPVIINITPVENLPLLLGVAAPTNGKTDVGYDREPQKARELAKI